MEAGIRCQEEQDAMCPSFQEYCGEEAFRCVCGGRVYVRVRAHRCQIRGRTQINSPSSSRLCSAEHSLLAWSCVGNLEPGMTPKNSRDYLQSVMMHIQIGLTKRSRSMKKKTDDRIQDKEEMSFIPALNHVTSCKRFKVELHQ